MVEPVSEKERGTCYVSEEKNKSKRLVPNNCHEHKGQPENKKERRKADKKRIKYIYDRQKRRIGNKNIKYKRYDKREYIEHAEHKTYPQRFSEDIIGVCHRAHVNDICSIELIVIFQKIWGHETTDNRLNHVKE